MSSDESALRQISIFLDSEWDRRNNKSCELWNYLFESDKSDGAWDCIYLAESDT